MSDEMSSYEHGFSEGVEQQIKIHERLKPSLQSQLKEAEEKLKIAKQALEAIQCHGSGEVCCDSHMAIKHLALEKLK
jgi:hypothetical protein